MGAALIHLEMGGWDLESGQEENNQALVRAAGGSGGEGDQGCLRKQPHRGQRGLCGACRWATGRISKADFVFSAPGPLVLCPLPKPSSSTVQVGKQA